MFPSPVGDLYFSMIVDVMSIITPDSFRPLSGTYISQCFTEKEIAENAYVSVPCRGLIFLNSTTLICMDISNITFPSPVGDLYFSINEREVSKNETRFPSPVGDLYFSIPSPQPLVNTGCIVRFAWEMIL